MVGVWVRLGLRMVKTLSRVTSRKGIMSIVAVFTATVTCYIRQEVWVGMVVSSRVGVVVCSSVARRMAPRGRVTRAASDRTSEVHSSMARGV